MIDKKYISKVAQLVFPRLNISDYINNAEYHSYIDRLIDFGVGGFCVFKGSFNEAKNLLPQLMKAAKIPLLFCGDFENGLFMRLDDISEFPHAMSLGKNTPEQIAQISNIIAEQCKSIGIFWNLAPVADINSNQDNPIINIRAFGETPEDVSRSAAAYFAGQKKAGIMSCYKHFPGHGDTAIDSHLSLPQLSHDKSRLLEYELRPFIDAIQNNIDSIMVGHLSVPSLDSTGTPASLSSLIIDQFLRHELKFNGIIVSDALDMKGVTDLYNPEETVLKAFSAGNDILLMPENPKEAIEYLAEHINSNDLERLEYSYSKLINKKNELNLAQYKQKNFSFKEETIQSIALKAANNSIEIDGRQSIIPVAEHLRICSLAFVQSENIEKPTFFFRSLSQALENDCELGFIDENITDAEFQELEKSTSQCNLFIFPIFYKSIAYSGNIGNPDKIKSTIDRFAQDKKKIIILFGNPYLSRKWTHDRNTLVIKAFSDSFPSIAAVIMKLDDREIPDLEHLSLN